MIIGIDPGTEKSGFVVYDFDSRTLIENGTFPNENILRYNRFATLLSAEICIECPENFGMVVGHHIFDTLFFIGRFYQSLLDGGFERNKIHRIKRGDIKYAVIGKRGGKDADIRAAMIARYGDTLKKTAKTYKLKAHEWQAFAAAEALWLKSKEGK